MDKVTKQESSIPVQCRISLVDMAKLDVFWLENGERIKSLSRLVKWSIELLCDILEANGKMSKEMSVAEAHRYLMSRDLYQTSMLKKSKDKIATAIRFEEMRKRGVDPRNSSPTSYNILHNKQSVECFEGEINIGEDESVISDDEFEKAKARIEEEKEKELNRHNE